MSKTHAIEALLLWAGLSIAASIAYSFLKRARLREGVSEADWKMVVGIFVAAAIILGGAIIVSAVRK